MSSKHAPRIGGDDYQHLYSWWLTLALKFPDQKIAKVIIEDKDARSVDDVTVRHESGTSMPDRFYQIKYHVDSRDVYSAEKLVDPGQGKQSMLEKFWDTWQHLRKDIPERSIELYLVSNWTWGQDDLGKWVRGFTDRIDVDKFLALDAPEKTIRELWQGKLKASDQDFREFISCLHFRLGYSASVLVNEQVVERMRYLRLKTDVASLGDSSSIVRNWLKDGRHEITLEILNNTLKEHGLYLPLEEDRCVTVYLESIESQKFERAADYRLAWRKYFVSRADTKGGHQLKDPENWNSMLLPQLYSLASKVRRATDCRFLRVRGKARNSCWLAFGFVFSEVAGYTLEVGQAPGVFWRTDAQASKDFSLKITSENGSPYGEVLHERESKTVAIGISINGQLDNDVRKYLIERQEEKIAALLLLTKTDTAQKIQSAGEIVALAEIVKMHAREFVKHWDAHKLLIFYMGPSSGACFIGHQLNAMGTEIQIMEGQDPGYAPSFLLGNK